jgi:putative glutamine amidotransferase
MGGDDVTPEFYSEKVTHARKFIKLRDFHEIELIRHYYLKEQGFIFGVCRGLQITSVALGYKLYQDIETEIGSKVKHASNDHPIQLVDTDHQLLKNMGLSAHFDVYSYHHQSVKFHAGGPLQVAALSEDGVIEALEFKNGKGLLVQFHPELKDSVETRLMMSAVSAKSRALHSCENVFN